MCRGAKSGSRILRYFTWSGGSICSGMSGRTEPIASVVDRRRRREHLGPAERLHRRFLGGEHVAHAVEADAPATVSRSARYISCGWRLVSGSSAEDASRPSPPDSADFGGSHVVGALVRHRLVRQRITPASRSAAMRSAS